MDVERIRKDFPILERKINGKKLVYFDNAATTQKPVQVIEAIVDFYKNHNSNLGRGVHTLGLEATGMYEAARKKVAGFIGARPEEIIFTNNATQGLNMVASAYGRSLSKSDEVVITIMEHHSNFVPWKIAADRTGAKFKISDINDDGSLDMQDYETKVGKDTAVVSATHVSNILGTINPVEEMAKIAHENGAIFVLDGAQSVAHMKTDVKRLDCDFLAFSGHKMLAPTGIGVLYGRQELLDDMEPIFTGGGAVSKTYPGDVEFLNPPHCFEAGTQNVSSAIGLAAAIDYLEKIGMDDIQKNERMLTGYALDCLADVTTLTTYGPPNRTGIISFNVGGSNSHDIALVLDEQGIATRSGHHCAQPLMHRLKIDGCTRMSFYIYNTRGEVDYFAEKLGQVSKLA